MTPLACLDGTHDGLIGLECERWYCRLGYWPIDREDVYQMVRIYLASHIGRYDPDRSAPSTFLILYARYALSVIRSHSTTVHNRIDNWGRQQTQIYTEWIDARFDANVLDDDCCGALLERYGLIDDRTPEDQAHDDEVAEIARRALRDLTPSEREVLCRRSDALLRGVSRPGDDDTLQAIADEYELTRERVRQVQEDAVKKMQSFLAPLLGREQPDLRIYTSRGTRGKINAKIGVQQ
jgi:RNA polymerase sigma factor (sigma-70 family)